MRNMLDFKIWVSYNDKLAKVWIYWGAFEANYSTKNLHKTDMELACNRWGANATTNILAPISPFFYRITIKPIRKLVIGMMIRMLLTLGSSIIKRWRCRTKVHVQKFIIYIHKLIKPYLTSLTQAWVCNISLSHLYPILYRNKTGRIFHIIYFIYYITLYSSKPAQKNQNHNEFYYFKSKSKLPGKNWF